MRRLIHWIFYLLTILIPLTFTVVNSELFEFPKFILLLAGTLMILVAWVIDACIHKNFRSMIPDIRNPISLGVLGILATQTLATIFSIHPYTSFWGYYSRFHQGLLTTMCYTMLYFAAIRWLDTKSTQKLIKISIRTSIFISLIAILEHYNLSLTCMFMTGLDHLKNVAEPFIKTTACWGANSNPFNRSFATIGQPNWLAAYLIPHFFLALGGIKTKNQKLSFSDIRYTIPSLILALALLTTKSRSGFLAFGLSYAIYWVLTLRQSSIAKVKSSVVRSAIALLALFILFGTPISPALSSLLKRQIAAPAAPTSGTVLETGGTESGDIRKIVWSGALKLIAAHPLLGTGPETFGYTYYWVRPESHNYTSEWEFLYNKAHNEYLNMAAGAGLIGLIAYLFWHGAMGYVSLRKIPRSKKVVQENDQALRAFYPVLGASLIGFTVTNFFGFSVIPVYFLMTLLAAFPTTLSQAETSEAGESMNVWLVTATGLLFATVVPVRLFYADLRYTQGKALLDLNQPAAAIPYLEQAASYRPSEDLYLTSLSESYALLAAGSAKSTDTVQQAQATTYRDHALQLVDATRAHNPWHLNYFKSRAKVYLALATIDPKYNQNASQELEDATGLAPTDPKLNYNLGLLYTRLGQYSMAIAEFQQTIKLKNDYPDPYYALTLLYEQSKQTSKIPDLLKEAKAHLATYSAQLKTKIDQYAPN